MWMSYVLIAAVSNLASYYHTTTFIEEIFFFFVQKFVTQEGLRSVQHSVTLIFAGYLESGTYIKYSNIAEYLLFYGELTLAL